MKDTPTAPRGRLTRLNRRDLLRAGALGAAVSLAPAVLAAPEKPGELLQPATEPSTPSTRPADPWRGLKVGVASYSFRDFPVDVAIKGIQRVALHYVSVKDFHLPMKSTPEQRREVGAKFRDAGITPLSCGVVTMKNDEADCRHAFEYARDLGVPTIVCNPDPESMDILDKLVKEFDIRLAIHNHGPEAKHFKSPYDVWKAVEGHDRRIGLCIDVGHTARAGADPAEAIRKCAARLYDVHFKDVSRTSGKNPSVEVEVGRGVLDVRGMLEALLEVRFGGHVGFEHEKDARDPLPGLAESVGYTKGVITFAPAPRG